MSWPPPRLWARQHEGRVGIAGEPSTWERGIPWGVKNASAEVLDFVGPPVIAAAIRCHDPVGTDGPPLLPRAPEQDLRVGSAFLHIAVLTMQGDTAIRMGRARQEGVGHRVAACGGALASPAGLPAPRQRARRGKVVLPELDFVRLRSIAERLC